jgi:hypothetical protein
MCRKRNFCSELGINPREWDLNSPLNPPGIFKEAIEIMDQVLMWLEKGDLNSATELLNSPLAGEIKAWYLEHGQMSGDHRFNGLGKNIEHMVHATPDPLKDVRTFESEVYERDSYICQYCLNRVMPFKYLKQIEKALGRQHFAVSARSNEGRHGFVYILRATADHVVPHNRGGRTNLDNLVTACWACNYGKSGYTLSEIGLSDPRKLKRLEA